MRTIFGEANSGPRPWPRDRGGPLLARLEPLREDVLHGDPIVVYALRRP